MSIESSRYCAALVTTRRGVVLNPYERHFSIIFLETRRDHDGLYNLFSFKSKAELNIVRRLKWPNIDFYRFHNNFWKVFGHFEEK